MRPAHVVEIQTPNNFILNGLWFGPKKPARTIVWIHGLSSSAFSKLDIVEKLVDSQTSVLTFSNRGHDVVARITRRTPGGKKISIPAGAAHEVFTDCVDDIQGAINFAKHSGAREVFLAGQSTGCQKAVYYASQKKCDPMVKAIILLAPISDYSSMLKMVGASKLNRAVKVAKKLVANNTPQELLPTSVWSDGVCSAQRFISLYTPKTAEDIFPYAQPERESSTLMKVKVPTLMLWAGKDEYADVAPQKLLGWFLKYLRREDVYVIPGADHGFKGKEQEVVNIVKKWLKI